mgnify:CR=1 FL=1
MWDVFISHASEDKKFVRDLAQALDERGVKVWYDETTLKLGDRLGESIDKGLSQSRFGIVVFSNAFFQKDWTRYELEGLINKEMAHGKTILPVWHHISANEVARYSPSLANKLAVSTDRGIDYVVGQIMEVVAPTADNLYGSQSSSIFQQPSQQITKPSTKGYDYNQVDKKQLLDVLINLFNLYELQDLCFDLDIPYEDLPGTTRSMKARELIQYMDRRGLLPNLVASVKDLRPKAPL